MADKTQKKGFFQKFLDIVERVGNKLPDPFALFLGLAFLIIVISWIASLFDASVIHPGNGEELPINSLVSAAGLQFILTSMLDNFTGFAPLGLVLSMMLVLDSLRKSDCSIMRSVKQSKVTAISRYIYSSIRRYYGEPRIRCCRGNCSP
nr:AbgT family transporter [Jeotgalicoccus sp. WY2]